MPEVTMSKENMQTNRASEVSARLTREVGLLAGRLADYLATSLPPNDGAMAEGQAFLWALYESVAEGYPLEAWRANAFSRRPVDALDPLDRLAQGLGLSSAEVELLLLAGLSEEHEGLAAILRALHPRHEPRATLGVAAQLLAEDRHAFRQMIETGAIVQSGAVRVVGDAPFYERSLQLADSLWSALHGIDAWPTMVVCLPAVPVIAGLEEWFDSSPARRVVTALQRGAACTVMLTADHEDVAFHRALALITQADATPMGIQWKAELEPNWEHLVQLHAMARGVVPVVKLMHTETQAAPPNFTNFPGVIVLCGRSGNVGWRGERPFFTVPIERLPPMARRRLWQTAVPALVAQASHLAARFPVEPAIANMVAADLQFIGNLEDRAASIADVAHSLRARGSVTLAAGAKLVHPAATWDDLVLAADRMQQLQEAVSRLEWQGRVMDEWGFAGNRTGARGVRLLFAGPSGTGKTLSAEVLANALGVDLLVIDLSRVVSKWIGETEKNLAAVFDAAERARAALFFDEADALFGKRTEVTDAHDRYANLETAYLLTRLEQFEGLAILATNLRQNIDPAFLRRLEFVVDFEEPNRAERLALWRCHLPDNAPLAEDVNLLELAALYPVVGAVIRNAAVAAAFLAAAEESPLQRRHFIHALRREYEKAGRSFPGS
jgi:hypothetical protein